jgi:hypothetical protein
VGGDVLVKVTLVVFEVFFVVAHLLMVTATKATVVSAAVVVLGERVHPAQRGARVDHDLMLGRPALKIIDLLLIFGNKFFCYIIYFH